MSLGTHVLYCEGKTIDAPCPCALARFRTLFVYSDIVQKLELSQVNFCTHSLFVNELVMDIWK